MVISHHVYFLVMLRSSNSNSSFFFCHPTNHYQCAQMPIIYRKSNAFLFSFSSYFFFAFIVSMHNIRSISKHFIKLRIENKWSVMNYIYLLLVDKYFTAKRFNWILKWNVSVINDTTDLISHPFHEMNAISMENCLWLFFFSNFMH